ncbi:LCP family protein [Corynebacterium sp. 335C]
MNAPQGPGDGHGPDDGREIVRGPDGRPRLDRFGRPIYRRPAGAPRPEHPERPAGFARGAEPRWERPLHGERQGSRDDARRGAGARRPGGDGGAHSEEGRPRDPRLDPAEIRRRAAEARRRRGTSGEPGRHRTSGAADETRVDMPAIDPRGRSGDTRLDRGRGGGAGAAGAAGAAGSTRLDRERPLLPGQDDPRFPPRGYRPEPPRRDDRYDGYDGYDGYDDYDGRGPRGRGRRMPRPGCGCGCLRPGRTLMLLVLVVLVVAGGGLLWADSKLSRTDVFAGLQDRPGRSIATNWLIIGSDSRAGLTDEENAELNAGGAIEGQRTDTIMIAHLPVVGKPTLVSIPRDSYVEIPGHGMDKINAAFAYGGAPLLVETVEKSTGVRIDHYAEVGLGGFAHIVDGMGGITLCPDQAIDDPMAGIDIQAGCQEFDGRSALGYVRTRATAQGDLDRVERQREFFGALMNRLRSPGVLLNPVRLLPTTNAALESMIVGDGDHSWHLARLVAQMAFGVNSETVPISGGASVDVGDVLYWDEAGSRELFDRIR